MDVVAKMSRDRTQARGRLEWLQDSQRLFADEVSEVGLALRLELGQFLDHLERWSRVPELLTQPRLAVPAAPSSVPQYAEMTSPRARVALTIKSGANMQSS